MRIAQNYAETAVSQNFRTRKSVKTAEFFIVKVTTVKEVIGRNITTF